MSQRPDDICPRPPQLADLPAPPLAAPIYPASVYRLRDPQQAAALLGGDEPGYFYRRDGHPNADLLAESCRALHGAQQAVVCGSGMAALAAAVLSQVSAGDHVIVSRHLYGRTLDLVTGELARLGIESSIVDTCDLDAVAASFTARTRLVVVETITNPLLRVSDLAALAALAHAREARLLVDNTFASPVACRPLEHGADLVVESLTKIINGHSDVVLGLVCGQNEACEPLARIVSIWGFTSSPFDCWLAHRGLATLAVRAARAMDNARRAADFLAGQRPVARVWYPGRTDHPDYALAQRQLTGGRGAMVTFTLSGGLEAARRFITAARRIPFAPSLGELSTTVSHPATTSHRGLDPAARAALSIDDGTLRLSVGIESPEEVLEALSEALGG